VHKLEGKAAIGILGRPFDAELPSVLGNALDAHLPKGFVIVSAASKTVAGA
jgi:hypothetical protein